MSKNLINLILSMLLFSSFVLAEDTREADHAALRALRDKAAAAINNMDLDALLLCLHEEFAFTTADQSLITNEKELKEYFDVILSDSRYSFPLESMKVAPEADILTRFISEDAGYCYGTALTTYVSKSGQSVAMDSRWSALVTKKNGEWKIEMVHAGVNFLDNPVFDLLETAANTKFYAACVAAAVFFLLLIILRRKTS